MSARSPSTSASASCPRSVGMAQTRFRVPRESVRSSARTMAEPADAAPVYRTPRSATMPLSWRQLRLSHEIHQHLHHRPAGERLLHPFLQIFERDATAHEGADGDGAGRREADGL